MSDSVTNIIRRCENISEDFNREGVVSKLREQERHVTADVIEGLCDRIEELELRVPRRRRKKRK